MKKLQLAKDLALPVDVVTQTIAVLAKRRAGKSYAMRRLVEQLFQAGQQVVLVDPKGDQWGLRSSADGTSPGLPFVILGGERGDVTLEANAGEVVARLVVEERVSVLLDLSLFRKHEVATFMTAFLEHLYRLKAKEMYRTPVMLVLDEADAIAPQKPQKGEERMLGAAEDIVRRGGQRGIGCVFVTQRSAVLNKNVLTQAQILIALRTIAPQDLAAMKAWIDVHGTLEQQKTLMESLPSLPIGDAWVWAPGWPTVNGIFKRVRILPIQTFDSGKSPEAGVKPVEPKSIADVDIDALKRQMSATIEKAKADDPRELRKQLAAAKSELAAKEKALAEVGKRTQRIDEKLANVRSTKDDARAGKVADLQQQLARHRRALEEAMRIIVKVKAVDFSARGGEALEQAVTQAVKQVTAGIEKRVTTLAERVQGIQAAAAATEISITRLLNENIEVAVTVQKHAPFTVQSKDPRRVSTSPRGPVTHVDAGLPGPDQKILASLAELEALGLHPADKQQLALMASYTNARSGGFSEPLGRLIAGGYVKSPQTGRVAITDAGRAAAGDVQPPVDSAEMQARIMAKLSGPEQKLLLVLIGHYPTSITKERLAAECDPPYTNVRSGGFSEPLGRLNRLGIARTPARGEVVASPALFLEQS